MSRNRRNRYTLPTRNSTEDNTNIGSPFSTSSSHSSYSQQQHHAAREMLRLHQNRNNNFQTPSPSVTNNSTDDNYSSQDTDNETVNTIASIIDVCNDVNRERQCKATESAVKRCIRSHIWSQTKFLTDKTLKSMNVNDKNNPHSIINILLKVTNKGNNNDVLRFRFWKKYGPMVQKELNTMKTVATRSIRTALMPGKKTIHSYSYQGFDSHFFHHTYRVGNGAPFI